MQVSIDQKRERDMEKEAKPYSSIIVPGRGSFWFTVHGLLFPYGESVPLVVVSHK